MQHTNGAGQQSQINYQIRDRKPLRNLAEPVNAVRPVHRDDVFMLGKDFPSSADSYSSYGSNSPPPPPPPPLLPSHIATTRTGRAFSDEMIYESTLKSHVNKIQNANRFISSSKSANRIPMSINNIGCSMTQDSIMQLSPPLSAHKEQGISSSGFYSSDGSSSSRSSSQHIPLNVNRNNHGHYHCHHYHNHHHHNNWKSSGNGTCCTQQQQQSQALSTNYYRGTKKQRNSCRYGPTSLGHYPEGPDCHYKY